MADDPLLLDADRRRAIEELVLDFAGRFDQEHRDGPPFGGDGLTWSIVRSTSSALHGQQRKP